MTEIFDLKWSGLDQLKIPFYNKGMIKKILHQVWLTKYSDIDIMSMVHSKNERIISGTTYDD